MPMLITTAMAVGCGNLEESARTTANPRLRGSGRWDMEGGDKRLGYRILLEIIDRWLLCDPGSLHQSKLTGILVA
jgi:hypothetical protein